MNGEVFTVKRLRLLQYLVNNGFKEYEIVPDPTSTKGYNWFLFRRSAELEAALDDYFTNHLKGSK